MKKCNKCGETKEFSEFNKCKSHKDGHQSLCRLCTKKHYASVRELRLVSMKEYYEKNKEKLIEDKKAWYKGVGKDVKRERNKAYYQANKEVIYNKRQSNREKIARYHKAYRKANKELRLTYYTRREALKKKLIPKAKRAKTDVLPECRAKNARQEFLCQGNTPRKQTRSVCSQIAVCP